MKKLLTILLMFFLVTSGIGQTTSPKEFYQERAKRQRSTATVMAVAGTAALGLGLLIGNRTESTFDDAAVGAIVGAVGVLTMLGSIPVYIASGINRRKAVDVTVSTGKSIC